MKHARKSEVDTKGTYGDTSRRVARGERFGNNAPVKTRIVQREAATLAGTPKAFRRFEIFCVASYPVLGTWLLFRLVPAAVKWPALVPIALLLGFLASDFISGFVHWLFDTWGTPDTPIVGKTFIRTFREHHVDEKAITRHDFVETNGSNIFGSVACVTLALYLGDFESTKTRALGCGFLFFLSVFTALTSQTHKWAHMDDPPRFVAFLQRFRLLLSPEHHRTHHVAPYEQYYCITSGWLNATLQWTRFFRVLEWVISETTGALPRQDDIGHDAALEVLTAEDPAKVPEPEPNRAD